jgi:hypothetical protein
MTIHRIEIVNHLVAFNPPSATVPRIIKRKGTRIKAAFPLPPCALGTPVLTTRVFGTDQRGELTRQSKLKEKDKDI